ncbi:MAG: hypothetical protein K0S80_4347 [Neobacillus sp.]|nr:hypothetical protein [Neobacillus sp.]
MVGKGLNSNDKNHTMTLLFLWVMFFCFILIISWSRTYSFQKNSQKLYHGS